MIITKNIFFSDFLGQKRKRKILICINQNIYKELFSKFIMMFKNINHDVSFFNSSYQLENIIKNSSEQYILVLNNKDITIQKSPNDKRLFFFQSTNTKHYHIKASEDIHTINFNIMIDDFFLSKCLINYVSLKSSLYIDISNVHGFGLFTNTPISKDEKLFMLHGEIVTKKYFVNKKFYGEWNALEDDKFLVRESRTSYGFINHSQTPNCKIDIKTMEVVATKKIKAHEEIFLNYTEEPLPQEYINGFGKTYL